MTQGNQKNISLEISLFPDEVYRNLDCVPELADCTEQHTQIEKLLQQILLAVNARAVYGIYSVEKRADHRLYLAGCSPISGLVTNHLQPAHRVVVFAITLGEEIDRKIKQHATDGNQIESIMLRVTASAATDAAVDALADHLHWNEMTPEECLSPPLCPGCCGFDHKERKTLLTILDTGAIGLKLSPDLTLQPPYSNIGLFGIGEHHKMEEYGIPCAHCSLNSCRLNPET